LHSSGSGAASQASHDAPVSISTLYLLPFAVAGYS
jgi:hypothetical protein